MKFSFQTLLIAVAFIAVAIAWGLDHVRLQKTITQLNAENTELIGRIIPSSGFAIPSGLVAKTFLDNSSAEDRQEVLRLLDQSITHGSKSSKPSAIVDTPH